MKKRPLWSASILVALLVLGYFTPSFYWRTLGVCRGEAFYEGRPTSYWREQIKEEEKRRNRKGRIFFGGVALTRREKIQEQWETWFSGGGEALEAMKEDVAALPVWRELLRDEHEKIRADAFVAILHHADDADLVRLVNFVMKDDSVESQFGGGTFAVLDIHKRYGDKSGREYYPWIDDEDPKRASAAITAVAFCGEASAPVIPQLLKRLDAEDHLCAADALANIGPKALPGLKDALKKDNVFTRRHATNAVGLMHAAVDERVPLLRQQLKDADIEVRRHALAGVGRIVERTKDAKLIALVIEHLDDPASSVRGVAIAWVREIGEPAKAAVPRLRVISGNDPDNEIRVRALAAIAAITGVDERNR